MYYIFNVIKIFHIPIEYNSNPHTGLTDLNKSLFSISKIVKHYESIGVSETCDPLKGALYCEQEAAIRVADETPHWPVL